MDEAAQNSTTNFKFLWETFLKVRYMQVFWKAVQRNSKLSSPRSFILIWFHMHLSATPCLEYFPSQSDKTQHVHRFCWYHMGCREKIASLGTMCTISVKYFYFKWPRKWACKIPLRLRTITVLDFAAVISSGSGSPIQVFTLQTLPLQRST